MLYRVLLPTQEFLVLVCSVWFYNIRRGADPNCVNDLGQSPLELAWKGSRVRALIEDALLPDTFFDIDLGNTTASCGAVAGRGKKLFRLSISAANQLAAPSKQVCGSSAAYCITCECYKRKTGLVCSRQTHVYTWSWWLTHRGLCVFALPSSLFIIRLKQTLLAKLSNRGH